MPDGFFDVLLGILVGVALTICVFALFPLGEEDKYMILDWGGGDCSVEKWDGDEWYPITSPYQPCEDMFREYPQAKVRAA